MKNPRDKRVLIVENDSAWLTVFSDAVAEVNSKAQIRAVSSFEDALTLLRTESWSLLVADIELDGGAVRANRGIVLVQEAARRDIPQVVVSEVSFEADHVNALKSATHHFKKNPYPAHEFQAAVTAIIGSASPTTSRPARAPSLEAIRVFICHGRNLRALDELKKFLQYIGLQPVTFRDVADTASPVAYTGDIVRLGMEQAGAVLVLFTPDEYAELRAELRKEGESGPIVERLQARPNVLFEAGLALGIDEQKTILVIMGGVSLLSNIEGRQHVYLDNGKGSRETLRARLGQHCSVSQRDLDLCDLTRAGDFETPVEGDAI